MRSILAVIALVFSLGVVMSAPALASECSPVEHFKKKISGWKKLDEELKHFDGHINQTSKDLKDVLQVQKDMDTIDKELATVAKGLKEVSMLAEEVPSLQKMFKEAAVVVDKMEKNVVAPARKSIDKLVKAGKIKTAKAEVDKAENAIKKIADGVHLLHEAMLEGGTDMQTLCTNIVEIERISGHRINLPVNEGMKDLMKLVKATNGLADKAAKPVQEVNHILKKDVMPVLKPVDKSAEAVHKALKGLKAISTVVHKFTKVLDKKIKIKVAKIVVVDESLGHLLKRMHKIEKDLEKKLKIKKLVKEAKHLISKATDKAIKPLEKEAEKGLKGLKKISKLAHVNVDKAEKSMQKLLAKNPGTLIQETAKMVKVYQ